MLRIDHDASGLAPPAPAPDTSRPDEAPDEERHLQHLQRMAMLGTLAAGLGHDLRNLVMPVLLRLDCLAACTDLPDSARRDLTGIRESVAHLQRLAGGLRLLGSDPFDQRDEPQFSHLVEWWQDLRSVVVDALPPLTVVEAKLPDDLPAIAIPPGVLAQVMMCLVMNARRAMEGTSVPRLQLRARTTHGRLSLEVTDNGGGMDPETRRRCFEPFFTTRPREYATGLGLSTSRALMTRYGGDLTLAAARGAGATFTMHLPIHEFVGAAGSGVARRVRLLVEDPRRAAVLRLIIAQRGLREVAMADAGSVDFVICDEQLLPSVVEAEHAGNGSAHIVALGVPSGAPNDAGVQWVDPGELAHLGDVLR